MRIMTVKVSANLDTGLVQFLEHYQNKHQIKTRSEALEKNLPEKNLPEQNLPEKTS